MFNYVLDVNYFHCLEIVELLKTVGCGEKNIFGQYSSDVMKAWNGIIKIYERDGMLLGRLKRFKIQIIAVILSHGNTKIKISSLSVYHESYQFC